MAIVFDLHRSPLVSLQFIDLCLHMRAAGMVGLHMRVPCLPCLRHTNRQNTLWGRWYSFIYILRHVHW